MLYPGYYLPEDRARRIVDLLEPKDDWTLEDVAAMINDVTSSVSVEVIEYFTINMDYSLFDDYEKKAIDMLKTWDGSSTLDQVAPTIYNKWIYFYLKNTFADEMGNVLFEKFMKTHLVKREIASHIAKDASIWWDDISTEDMIETRKDILSRSLKDAVSNLKDILGDDLSQWTWDKVLILEHPHALGKVESLRNFFNVGPFPVKGAREVLDNKGYHLDESKMFEAYAGPSTRRVIDFSDVENSLSILPTGQSGNPFSEFYKDQAKMYLKGEFRKMKMNRQEIEQVSTLLVIRPEN
jgi:penicillin amidase